MQNKDDDFLAEKEELQHGFKELIVSAASRFKVEGKIIVVADSMHWGQNIQNLFFGIFDKNDIKYEQIDDGFINNVGDFKTREEAMEIVKKSGQPFNINENNGDKVLFSEGLRRIKSSDEWAKLTNNY